MKHRRHGFSLVELLVVMGIVAVLMAMVLPALRRARLAAEQTACASNLRQMGNALLMYVNDNRGHLPLVVEPLWTVAGKLDFNADPFDFDSHRNSFPAVMKSYLKSADVFTCKSAALAYPRSSRRMTYRVSAANNYDGQPKLEEQLFNSNGTPQYAYSLKYLNGRKHRLRYVDANYFPLRISSGVGPFYLVRDFVSRDENDGVTMHPPHNKNFNQLALDFSVSLERNNSFSLTYP